MEAFKMSFSDWLNTQKVKQKQEELSKLELKYKAFEYVIYNLIEWWMESNETSSIAEFNKKNDFSTLKVMLITFFSVTVNTTKDDEGLLKIFDNWEALPYGPREADIYKRIMKNPDFGWFKFDKLKHKLIIS